MKTANLIGPALDYWVARAEGVPPESLEIRRVQRSDDYHCVLVAQRLGGAPTAVGVIDYSTSWRMCGPLIEQYRPELVPTWPRGGWYVRSQDKPCDGDQVYGETVLVAVCRAIVRAAFGDEVDEVPPCA